MNNQTQWQAVLRRDSQFDGQFVFAVRTTRIYCRPSCPARRPHRENVVFFAQPQDAERAGFRACQRCHPNGNAHEPQAELMQQVARHIENNLDDVPTLDELGKQFHLSAGHLQKTFKQVIGVTPRQYAAAKRAQKLKSELKRNDNVADALYNAGYASSSRVYEKSATPLGVTPKTYQRGGLGMELHYTIVNSVMGRLLVAGTPHGICFVGLGDSDAQLIGDLNHDYPRAEIQLQTNGMGEWVNAIVRYLDGQQPHLDLPLDVQGTAFQKQVWDALRKIPYGQTRSYGEVAKLLGQPNAARAVGRACNTNRAALVIPCHRVVASDGDLTGYRWGMKRKEKLLAQERDGVKG